MKESEGRYSMSRVVWDCSPKMGGKLLPRLKSDGKPIANKYCEGKMKRTLERELKVPEIAERKALKTIMHPKGEGLASNNTASMIQV